MQLYVNVKFMPVGNAIHILYILFIGKGTLKWVHQNCLQRWVDEKQKGNSFKRVQCQQCQTEYIIVLPNMGIIADLLEGVDNVIRRSSPFIAAGIFVGSFYWTAVTYGAITSKTFV